MKKILILLVVFFFLGGCYDYYELNDLAIVVGIGIDYKDDNYIVTYEIISNNTDKESANTKSYTVSEKNKSFPKAMDLTSDAVSKRAYFSHADLLVLSKEIATNHMEDIIDYLLRNNNIRETLNVIITTNPEELLSGTTKNLAVISSSINDALDADRYSGSYALKKKYLTMAQEMLTTGEDAAISIVDVKKDKIAFQNLALFKDYKMIGELAKEKIAIYNLLKNKTNNVIIDTKYDGKLFSNSIYASNIKIKVSKDTITVTGSVEAQVLENQPNIDLKEPSNVKKIEKTFAYILNEQITELITSLQETGSDILYLGQNYYNSSRDKQNIDLWQKAKIKSNVKFNITKKGIIYEVKDAN